MTDIRSRAAKNVVKNVNDLAFKVESDTRFTGFKIRLFWTYNIREYPNVIGFKIYRATLPKPKLKKKYTITQKILEKTTGIHSFPTKSNILYDKSRFSQNSLVRFESSNSNKHDKAEGEIYSYNYVSLHLLRANVYQVNYFFEDRNIKFGETYSYYVTAVTSDFRETTPVPVLVSVEDLSTPPAPSYFEVSEIDKGLLLIIGSKNKDVTKFKIYRREDSEKEFELLTEIDNNQQNVYYTDVDIFPKKNYVYRVYSENIFGNISLEGAEKVGVFRYTPITTNIEYQPSIQIDGGREGVRIRVKNERPDKVHSVRIERRDDWRFERGFNLKSYNGFPWTNNHFFSGNVVDFTDKAVVEGRAYSYRITSFDLKGFPIAYYISPPLVPGDSYSSVLNNQSPIFEKPSILSFDLDVVNSRQLPVFVKCSWQISGDWSYLIIKTDQDIKIDNIHKSVFLDIFKPGNKYNIAVEVYDLNNQKTDEYRNIILSV